MEMHLQKLEMHLQNSWKCICKIHENAFAKATIFLWLSKSHKCIFKIQNWKCIFFSRVVLIISATPPPPALIAFCGFCWKSMALSEALKK
jgi:hypothetical protein